VDAERLAAYLAGELDADEATALDAALAREPRVRAQLDAMRRADEALRDLPATELPAGFESRLRTAVDAELATVLRPHDASRTVEAASDHAAGSWTDRLAARRTRRSRSWVPAFAGAAAAVAVVAGVAVGVGVLGGGRGDDAASDTAMMLDAEDADTDGSEEVGTLAEPGPGEGPTLLAADRDLDDDLADELLASIELQAVTDRGLDASEGRSLGSSWREAIGQLTPAVEDGDRAGDAGLAEGAGEADEDAEDAEDAPMLESEEEAALAPPGLTSQTPVRVFAEVPLLDEDLAVVDRCLAEVLEGGTDAIPAYLELGNYQGEPAVVLGLVTFDPATGAYTRPEVWVVAREDCQVLRFSQG
jgi:negative regulator of sigma E activity